MADKTFEIQITPVTDAKAASAIGTGTTKESNVNSTYVEGKEEEKEDKKRQIKAVDNVSKAVHAGSEITSGILKGTFDIVQQLYTKLKQSSPLLETIESLFNLAMTLLFMPLGNALGETFIPMAIELIDNIVAMWETFDAQFNNGDLAGMLTTIMTTGVHYIGEFIEHIGESLKDQGGLLGSIGRVLDTLGQFIQGGLVNVIDSILKIVTFVMDHIKELVSLFVAFQASSMAMDLVKIGLMITQIQTTASAGGFLGTGVGVSWAAAEIGTAAALGVGVGAGVGTYMGLSSMGLAEGGYVPATAGGQLITIGEGGEGEYVIPESKMNSISTSSAQNITNNFYGYTQAELVQIVKDTLRDELLSSRYTGVI